MCRADLKDLVVRTLFSRHSRWTYGESPDDGQGSNFLLRFTAVLLFSFLPRLAGATTGITRLSGAVLDPAGLPVPGARVEVEATDGRHYVIVSGKDGRFSIELPTGHEVTIHVAAPGFAPITRSMPHSSDPSDVTLQLQSLSGLQEQIVVNADVGQTEITSPDPSQRVLVREQLLDANPGRPGAPVSIPGLPIETASGGIKAPQYFAPGVAGDHGEPIAQYIGVGGYLVPNNLSANAHGNGYADPNLFISGVLGSVETDGGAYNVLEGNHALNLAATYALRPQLDRSLTFTGDEHDADLTLGLAPSDPSRKEWLALEANIGNGLLLRLEHRQQYKGNLSRVFDRGTHEVTVFGDAYYGTSHEGNLVPLGEGVAIDDTVDPRQRDQTHTSILAVNDEWRRSGQDQVSFSAFFRTYNLALFSNFGEGLIRQSEFRTVEGAEARETHTFSYWLEGMAGLLYNEDDIHNDNLDHYLADAPTIYGQFRKVLSNDVTLRELAPYVALHGKAGQHLRFYAGLRSEAIQFLNTDKVTPAESFSAWRTFENPKATVTWAPGSGPTRWLPSASFSLGQAFFTQDPRINLAPSATGLNGSPFPSPFERSHSEQLVFEKTFHGTDARLTLSRTSATATLAKIDPDNGSADDLGPSTNKFLTVNLRHQFGFGTIGGILSKADARLATFNGVPGALVPEAPRTIMDALTSVDKLPFGLRGRAEYEYVGHKFLDIGNANHPGAYEAIPVGETRIALVRTFLEDKLEVSANGLIARGYTGQTTETFDPAWTLATSRNNLPYCSPGSGPSGSLTDFDCGTVERAVGIRMVSWVGASLSYRFQVHKAAR